MEGMAKHMARRHPGDNGKKQVMMVICLVAPIKMTIQYDIDFNNYEVKEVKVMLQRLNKCRFCGLLGCGDPHYEFKVRPCKVMITRLKECY
jgi:hypothetical protein